MEEIKIINLKKEKPVFEYDIRVDRTSGSPLGNPFYMKDEIERDVVCDKYIMWFDGLVLKKCNRLLVDELQRILKIYKQYGKLRLFCWCAPKRCHAETIRDWFITGEK